MKRLLPAFLVILLWTAPATAWHDETHLAIAKAAGYEKFYNAAGADMIKVKAAHTEAGNHYFNNTAVAVITAETVLQQAALYDQPGDAEGHLLGAIIGSLRRYSETRAAGKYAEYHLAFAAHYIGDLSNPLHHIPYDDYNKAHHAAADGVIEAEALKNILLIERNMYEIRLATDNCERDLAAEIARIANMARELAITMRKEGRDMTKGEAYVQVGHGASLLKAWLGCYRHPCR